MTARMVQARAASRLTTAGRLARVLRVLSGYGVVHFVSGAVARVPSLRRVPWMRRVTQVSEPERFRDLFQDLGGTFLKFGQMLALQPDILSVEYCNALFDLLDRVVSFPFEDVERTFREDLGRLPRELFDEIDVTPLASASIGQVHVATVAGRRVAVKVQRPTAGAEFTSDIRLMSFAAGVIRRMHLRPLYWLLQPIGEFVQWTTEELDYRREARYMERLRRNAEANPHEHVPEVLSAYTTQRILVTEFLAGDTVLAYLRSRASGNPAAAGAPAPRGFDPETLASHIIDNFLGDVFRHGMFHADLHPANLVILPDNVVGYIDFGITGTISRYTRQNLVALTLAYTRGDLGAMCGAFFRVSTIDAGSSVEDFRGGLERASRSWYAGSRSGGRLTKNFTLVMLDMLRLSRETGIWPERDVIKYIRSTIAIDGLITRLAPGLDVRRHIEQVCAGHVAGHLSYANAWYEAVAACANGGLRMLRTGGTRAAVILERCAGGDLPIRIEFDESRHGTGLPGGAVAAACLVGAAGWLIDVDSGVVLAELSAVVCIVALFVRMHRGAVRTRIES